MITLKNEHLTVTVDEFGAQMRSLVCDDSNYLWSGDPLVWEETAPILFPICGGLKDDKYILNGKEYTLPKHGYGRNTLFEVESVTDTNVVLLHKSSDETKVMYPFDYEFRVCFALEDKEVKINYILNNLSSETMYFGVGAHEGYATPEGIEDYDLIFDEEETLGSHYVYGNLLSRATYPIIKDSRVLPLYDKYFLVDALVFSGLKSKAATLRNRKTGRAVRVEFPDATYLLLWHKHGAGFMCVEPWLGAPDFEKTDFYIENKDGITALEAGKSFNFAHNIKIVE